MRRRPEHADVYVQLGVAVRALELVTEALVTEREPTPPTTGGVGWELNEALKKLQAGHADYAAAVAGMSSAQAAQAVLFVLSQVETLTARVGQLTEQIADLRTEVREVLGRRNA